MSETTEPLIYDFVEWVAKEARSHTDVMTAWRTSCPRLTIWEDAVDRGLVARQHTPQGASVVVTARGRKFLKARKAN